MPPPDPLLLRVAARVHRRLNADSHGPRDRETGRAIERLLQAARDLERCSRLLGAAERRGRRLAAGRLRADLPGHAGRVHAAAAQLLTHPPPDRPDAGPMLRLLYDELAQVGREFDQFDVDLADGGVVAVETERVVLDGLDLGPFAIRLPLGRLSGGGRPDATCFECIALDPRPACGHDAVTHPHVRDDSLCAGEASIPIMNALRDGRLADAFCLVRAVLQAYNAGSAYVQVEAWSGVRCRDCGRAVDPDDLHYCDGCDGEYCDDCYAGCDGCGEGRCRGCLEREEASGNLLCDACRATCGRCGRTVDKERLDERTGLCPACREEREAQQQDEEEDDEDTTESDPERARVAPFSVA